MRDGCQSEGQDAIEERIEKIFPDPDSTCVDDSPCGRYVLEMTRFAAAPPELTQTTIIKKDLGRMLCRGVVREKESGKPLARVVREAASLRWAWVDHSNGNSYLLSGQTDGGYTAVNLTTGEIRSHCSASEDPGVSFGWDGICPSLDGDRLAVFGWMLHSETTEAVCVLLDFQKPDALPYPELTKWRFGNAPGRFGESDSGWRDNETFVYLSGDCHRKRDGELFDLLGEELEDASEIGIRIERVILRPGREPEVELVSER